MPANGRWDLIRRLKVTSYPPPSTASPHPTVRSRQTGHTVAMRAHTSLPYLYATLLGVHWERANISSSRSRSSRNKTYGFQSHSVLVCVQLHCTVIQSDLNCLNAQRKLRNLHVCMCIYMWRWNDASRRAQDAQHELPTYPTPWKSEAAWWPPRVLCLPVWQL